MSRAVHTTKVIGSALQVLFVLLCCFDGICLLKAVILNSTVTQLELLYHSQCVHREFIHKPDCTLNLVTCHADPEIFLDFIFNSGLSVVEDNCGTYLIGVRLALHADDLPHGLDGTKRASHNTRTQARHRLAPTGDSLCNPLSASYASYQVLNFRKSISFSNSFCRFLSIYMDLFAPDNIFHCQLLAAH